MRRAPLATAGVKAGALVRPLACWLPCLLLAAPLWAGQVSVVEGDGPDQVAIETTDASADEILAALAGHFGFDVERSVASAQAVRYSGRLQGSLDALLERLLRHEGHMIVHSRQAQGGIERVVVLDARGVPPTSAAAPTASVAGPIAAIKAKLREREETGR